MKLTLWSPSTIAVLIILFAGACTQETAKTGQPQIGDEGAECFGNATCNDGLVCASDLCVRPPDASTEDAGDEDTSGPEDATDTSDANNQNDPSDAAGSDAAGSDAAGSDAAGSDAAGSDAQDSGDAPSQQPSCTIDAPADATAQQFDERWNFTATATDPQDGSLSGAQISWDSDLDGALGTGGSVQTDLSASGSHVITCTATDTDGNTGTDQITVIAESPRAEIFHPGDGETRNANSTFAFRGRGLDAEDGNLPGSNLMWTSSIDGPIGTGRNFTGQLSAGTNVVTLTVTDSDGNSSSTSVSLNMQ